MDIKKNPILCILIAMELIVVVFMVQDLFRASGSYKLYPDNFEKKEKDVINWQSENIPLHSGAYTVDIYYRINKTGDDMDSTIQTYFESLNCPIGVNANELILYANENHKTDTIWVKYGANVYDLKLYITGDTDFELQEIFIKECPVYRFVRLIGIMLAALIVDLLWMFFLTDICTSDSLKKVEGFILLMILAVSSVMLISNTICYGHDLDFHLNRIVSIANGLREKQFPIRMHSDMLNGYGYPVSIFYGNTLLYFPALLYLLKIPLGMCYQMYILLNNILTICFMYLCMKTMTGRKKYALLGVFLYVLSPYRLVNIYTRAAVGEFTAMTFFPLIVLGIWNIYSKDEWKLTDYLSLIIGASGVVQSHVISTEMTVIFVILVGLACFKKTFEPQRLLCILKAGILTLLLNLWFLVPMLDSLGMGINVAERAGRMQEQGLYPAQWFALFFSGVGKSLKNTAQNEMGLTLGAALFIGMMISLYVYSRRRRIKENGSILRGNTICLGLGIVALMLTSIFFPWDILASRNHFAAAVLCMIQYPWRYLAIAALLLSVAAVLAVYVVEFTKGKRFSNVIIIVLAVVSLISTGYYIYSFTCESQSYRVLNRNNLNDLYIMHGEYLLSGTDVKLMHDRTIYGSEDVDAEELEMDSGKYLFHVDSDSEVEAEVVLPILKYDNYRVYDKDTGAIFDAERGYNNCIAVTIPADYKGTLAVAYVPRKLWRMCDIVSVLSIIFIIAILAKNKAMHK